MVTTSTRYGNGGLGSCELTRDGGVGGSWALTVRESPLISIARVAVTLINEWRIVRVKEC
jgi:hypothetical protein